MDREQGLIVRSPSASPEIRLRVAPEARLAPVDPQLRLSVEATLSLNVAPEPALKLNVGQPEPTLKINVNKPAHLLNFFGIPTQASPLRSFQVNDTVRCWFIGVDELTEYDGFTFVIIRMGISTCDLMMVHAPWQPTLLQQKHLVERINPANMRMFHNVELDCSWGNLLGALDYHPGDWAVVSIGRRAGAVVMISGFDYEICCYATTCDESFRADELQRTVQLFGEGDRVQILGYPTVPEFNGMTAIVKSIVSPWHRSSVSQGATDHQAECSMLWIVTLESGSSGMGAGPDWTIDQTYLHRRKPLAEVLEF